jgi:chromate transporter
MYFQIFFTFFKIGLFTFGGGYAMIPLIEREIVVQKKWLSKENFIDFLILSQAAPGILAANISILTGNFIKGKKGAFAALLGTVLPSFFAILLIVVFLVQFQNNQAVNNFFRAVRPAVAALVAVPVFNLAQTAKLTWKTAIIPILAALMIWKLAVSPILIIATAAIMGILLKKVTGNDN